jgi:hypothetical protein
MIKTGLVGSSYQQRSLPFDAQRSVNLYPIVDQQGKEVSALYGTPGLSLFATTGNGSMRGCFASDNGRAFFVCGSELYEVDQGGTSTLRGNLDQSSGNITVAENPTQMAICDGVSVYIYTYSTNNFVKASSGLPSSVGTISFIDGYFIVNENNTGRFYISAINDGLAWDALDFATAESSPDNLVRCINTAGQLWLFGVETTEIWSNTGRADFPFRRISGAKMDAGAMSPYTVLDLDNSVFWVGRDNIGRGMVYRTSGFQAQRISTEPIEKILQANTQIENLVAFSYQEEGHVFYVITGDGMDTSLVYDLTTGNWHERAYLNSEGNYEPHLARCHCFAFGKHLVGDRRNGNIYEMSLDYFDDNGDALLRERIYTHISDNGQRIRFNALEIGFEVGVGLQSGQGSNPLVFFSLSKDGGKTWSDEYSQSIGAVGEYMKKVEFRRLGIAEIMTFRLKISEPVRIAIIGSYLR